MSTGPTNKNIGNAAIFIYIETFVSLILGYVFWIVMSKLGDPEIIGTASAVITFSGILSVISQIGIPTGVQRFLGKSFAISSLIEIKNYLFASFIIISISTIAILAAVLLFNTYILSLFNIDHEFFLVSLLLMVSTSFATFFRGIVVSSLQTKVLTIAMSLSSVVKLILGVILLVGGLGAFGLLISYTINQVLICLILALYLSSILIRKIKIPYSDISKKTIDLKFRNFQELFSASVVFWIPYMITTIGSQIGTIFVYGSSGSGDAGLFFIALTIVTGITSVMYSLFTISFPALSAMSDGRKRLTINSIRLSLIIAIPFSSSLIFYSEDVLALLGGEYTEASGILDILLLSMLPTAVQYGITSLVYSYGKYRQVLLLGLSTSLPRVIMYFTLVPLFGGIGGAVGFTLGALIGFGFSVYIASQNKTQIEWRKLILIFAIPMIFSFVLSNLQVFYVVGILLNLIGSYVVMFALRLILHSDLVLIYKSLPGGISTPLYKILKKIKKNNS